MRNLTINLLISILFACLTLPALSEASSSEMIRIAILKGKDSFIIEGSGLSASIDSENPKPVESPVMLRLSRGVIIFANSSAKHVMVTGEGNIKLNGKSYRGIIDVIASGNGLMAVNELPLEHYLIGLINSEISSTWPMESVKAQAVIARTFALYRKNGRKKAPYHMESTVMDQAYNGSDLEDSRAARGVHETEGLVLTYNGQLIQAFYHASCGGSTEESSNVWGMSLPYLTGVACNYCSLDPSSAWEQALPLFRIESALKLSGLTDIRIGGKNSRGRAKNILLTTSRGVVSIPATKFRMTIGSTVIKSTNLNVRVESGVAYFSGKGYGHGVGLCQAGSKQRALDGFTFEEILAYYYPGTELSRLTEVQ